MKGDQAASETKILAVTGYDTRENEKTILLAGADGYLAKPVPRDVLLNAIAGLLDDATKRPEREPRQGAEGRLGAGERRNVGL